ncbi:MAG: redoxin [Opitutia bacterium Tous-C1TDCM]|nr:MAG: redoxin [Opitutae bacterium Tous-C1TDCM]
MPRSLRLLLRLSAFLCLVAAPLRAADSAKPPLLDKAGNPAGFKTLALGDAAPDFALPGIDGRTYRLQDFAGPDVLMVLFTSNHCPTSHGIEGRLMKLRNDYRGKSFGLVLINPNHPDGLSADELGYGEFGDSFEEMKPYAKKNGWDFPYLYDGDTQQIARAYGCLATPHVFIFDQERKLRYAGAFDDSRYPQEETVKKHYVRDALADLFAGSPVAVAQTKPFGCSTKWREKREKHQALEASWTTIPVTIEPIDTAGVAALRANPTGKYRLFNIWATWCGPCVEEFPDLVAISRKFDLREFELITLSFDDAKQLSKAQAFLQKQGAGLTKRKQNSVEKEGRKTNHYLYSAASQEELMKVLDPKWPGPIPHTVLVAPGGEIVWRHNGVIDPKEAIAKIVEAMTPYYQPAPPAPAKAAPAKKTE